MENEQTDTSLQGLRGLIAGNEEREEMLQQIAELFPALIYVFDAHNKKLRYINKRVTELLGYDWTDVEAWDNDLNKMIFEEDLPLVQDELKKYYSLEGNSSYAYKCRLNHKANNYRYFRTIGTVLKRDDQGSASSMLFLAEDITDQVMREEEARAARRLLEDAERTLEVGMWSWDRTTDKMEWSEGMYTLMGYTREELPEVEGKFLLSRICDNDKAEVTEKVRRAIQSNQEYRMDYSVTRKNGERIFITSIGKPVANAAGEVEKVTGYFRNISDQLLQNLESKASLELQVQTEILLNYGVYVMDLASKEISWSEGLNVVFEKKAGDPPITYDFYLSMIHEDDRDRVDAAVQQSLENKSDFEIEYSIHTLRGNLITVNSRGRVVVDNSNKPIRIIGKTRDITKVRQVETELQRSVRELNRSNKELEEFAYAASHDLQEPLRKITTFGSRLREKFSSQLGEEGKMYLDRMEVASGNMRNLIENLLELSRVSRSSHSFETVDLNKIAADAISDLEIPIEESGAVVQVDELPSIEGIPSQFRQMFINLLGNALKFHKPGVKPLIRIHASRLTRKEKELHLLRMDKNYYQVNVEDNGIGFDQGYEQRIFQIFQRLHGKSDYPGSGIGLSICKRIAERHNGQIFASGKPGEGAIFSCIIPEKQ